MLESKIQSKITNYLNKNGFVNNKILSASHNAFPDIIAIKTYITYYFEVKQPAKELKPLQELKINSLNKIKKIAFCVKSYEQFIEIWEGLK